MDNIFDQYYQWPKDRPRPTPEEYEAAVKRWSAHMDEAIKRGYGGDMLCGLPFTMSTYSRPCWWHFFFPDEEQVLEITANTVSWTPVKK